MQSTMLRQGAFGGVRAVPCSQRCVAVQAVQEVKGRVVSTRMNKTVIVEAERLAEVTTYQKRKNVTKRYMAHDESGEVTVGDFVRLTGCRPLSKTKRFTVSETLRKAD